MKTAIAALAALSALSTTAVSATPVYDRLAERFDSSLLVDPVGHLAARQQSSNSSLPDGNVLSYTVPPPTSNGGKAWKKAHGRATALVAQMTLQEKIDIVTGQVGRCAGNTGAIERLNLPSLCLQDGPAGVRPATGKTQFPAEVTVAATWDRDLIYQRAKAMGQEFYDLGIHVALAPVTGGPLGRAPREGRNWEGLTADPYSTGIGSWLSVKGIQDAGVVATSKHYIAYEQETFRNLYGATASYSIFPASEQLPISSNLDDKTTHELYLWPFAEAVRAGTGHVMCSYNRVNGTHSCSNSVSQNKILKGELNFQGSIMSDWGGTWGTKPFVEGGLDWEMPGLGYGGSLGTFFDDQLLKLVQDGSVKESRLDDQVTRILTPYFAYGQADKALPPTAINAVNVPDLPIIYRQVQKESTRQLIKKIGEDAAILLKNEGGLPLNKPQRIAVIGSDAGPNVLGYQACGPFGDGCPITNNNGTFSLGLGSGYSQPLNLITPLTAIQERAAKDFSRVTQVLNNSAIEDIQSTASDADVALVFVSDFAVEGQDKETLELNDYGNEIIAAAAAYNNNTVVVMHISGPTIIEKWVNHPNVTAILAPLLPGEQTGPSVVSVLYGDVSPSGKLPFTIGKQESDYPPNTIVSTPVVAPEADFTEGLDIDYRWFDTKEIAPRYEFGFGLSYSSFEYSNAYIKDTFKPDDMSIQETHEKFQGQKEGESIYDTVATVYTDVKNVGDVTACEVAQLYIEFPAGEKQPPRQMRGFDKLKQLKSGETRTAAFPIRRKDIMVWDTVLQMWRLPKGDSVTFHAGASSRKLPLSVKYAL